MSDYILVVEDEALIAMDIEMMLLDQGLGPIRRSDTAEEALEQINAHKPRAAVLDVNLARGGTSVAVAERLAEIGTPYMFLSGQGAAYHALPDRLSSAPSLAKPFNDRQLAAAVTKMLAPEDPLPA